MKVKCIRCRPYGELPYGGLVLGQIYEVAAEYGWNYDLVPVPGLENGLGWHKDRFEVVEERKLLGYRVKTDKGWYLHYRYGQVEVMKEKPEVFLTKVWAVQTLLTWLKCDLDGHLVKVYSKAK